MSPVTLGFIGAGRVGGTLAQLWSAGGWPVRAVYSRSASSAEWLAEQVDARACVRPGEVVAEADLIFLTAPDQTLPDICAALVNEPLAGKSFVHASGALPADALQTLKDRGAQIGSLHPVYAFSRADAEADLTDVTVALEADEPLLSTLHALVAALGARPVDLVPGSKALYHAALTLTGAYVVTLYAQSIELLQRVGLNQAEARSTMDVLLASATANLVGQLPPAALTGAISRGDAGTVRAHVRSLSGSPAILDVYRRLGLLTVPLYEANGGTADQADAIRRALQGGDEHAQNGA